ncbi:SusC/RagA family TonB-linked outer membrane protein [Sphingobacterium sp. DK4209]|uniref:SusC/RagA family TonB-linked outer membrane protein n=1 Tax=Sphingobacterium zhuxiongii TaxID=2662364 RepID=A0A5Q0QAK4_9SPHI|nr:MULTISPECIES: TonB-dependent receptor [unclassified Sphingobacterium]MVZ67009.1 SusC/RagA family TonB-linked outer membrane protein [Sphingobacterium sp. DK4209]QGA25931.1 SusC/RagA family TonB-linked outer membrane protein [Sphingobacterium sp. dk4302]
MKIPWKREQLMFFFKTLIVMKILTLICAFTLLHASTVLSQQVNFRMKNASIDQVLLRISKEVNYDLVFDSKIFLGQKKLDVEFKNTTVKNALNQIFTNRPFTYEIVNEVIVIRKKEAEKAKTTSLNRQQQIIKGRVTDPSNNPLSAVTVVIKNSQTASSTDAQGQFEIAVPSPNAILVFSLVGYKEYEISPHQQTVLNIQLEPSINNLDEVVVVGYGTQNKRLISGSVSNLKEEEFNKGVNRNAVDLLRGKIPGLSITSGSGDVSKGETIRLRGTSSLTGSSSPFVVIDGVPGMNINSVAPQDIESISVLKDASAAAIYGSRSAGGVILITTKKGKANNPIINYEGYAGVDKVSNKPKMLSADGWRTYVKENNLNVSGLDKGANTDWFDEILRTGVSQNHSLSVSGGNDNSVYRGSMNYLDRQGLAIGNDLKLLNGRLAFTQKAMDNKLEISLIGGITQRDYSPTNDRNFVLAYNMLPVYPVKNDDGTWFDSRGYDEGNPVRNLTYNSIDNKESRYFLNAQGKINILSNLIGRVNVLRERGTNDYGAYNHSETESGRDDGGFASRQSWTNDRTLLETTLEYSLKSESLHNLSVLGGYSYEDNHYQNAGAQSRQFVTDFFEYNNLSAGEVLRAGDVWSGANMNKLISFFGRANYSYDERYVLSATLRRDGSSKFGKNHKWGLFPSVSAAWNILREPFVKQELFDDLKLRAGYGVIGNQDGLNPYQTLELYAASGRYYDNGSWYQAYQIGQNANPDLKWEETAMFNVGIDFSMLKGRLSGTVEYYNKNTNDLLYMYQVPVPPFLYPSMIANVGSMSNRGVEVLLNGTPISKENFKWNVSVNFARNKNEVTKLSNANFSTSSIKLGSAAVRGAAHTTTHILEEGREVGTFFGWKSLGLDADGKYIFDDMIDGKAGLTDDDRTYIGSAQPKFTYGINNSFNYRNLDFSFFLRGVYGNDVLNFSRMAYATTLWLPGGNVLEEALTNGLKDNPKYSSFNIEKGSFLRLDNATIGYSFPANSIKYVKGLRLYVNGQNLFLITNYKGMDPEVDMGGLAPGMEGRNYYPKARTVSFGLNLTL